MSRSYSELRAEQSNLSNNKNEDVKNGEIWDQNKTRTSTKDGWGIKNSRSLV